jgi:hypothetical protein
MGLDGGPGGGSTKAQHHDDKQAGDELQEQAHATSHELWNEANNIANPCQLQARGSVQIGKFSQSFQGIRLWTAGCGFALTTLSAKR